MHDALTPDTIGAADESEAAHIRESIDGQFVCPFCGVVNSTPEGLCPRCSMENTSAARKATRARIGPWFVYQHRNPAAPGMKFETLLAFVRKGKVKPRSIVRGPTSNQLWRFAAHIKGLSREFGVCYSCGGAIETTANLCPHCNHLQEPPPNPDVLLESTSGESSRRPPVAQAAAKPASPPARPAPIARPGPFSGGSSDVELAEMDDLLSDDESPSRPAMGSAPVATFRKSVQQDNFLSARELATAFNLGFTPPNGSRGRGRRKGGWVGRILVFCLLVICGTAAGIFARPELRQRALVWGSQKWKTAQAKFTQKGNPTNKPSESSSQAANDHLVPRSVLNAHALPTAPPDAANKASPPVVTQTPPVKPPAADHRPAVPEKKPAEVVKAPQDKPVDVPQKQPEVKSAPTQPQPPPKPNNTDAVPTDAAEQARSFYNQGIDAEQHVDFASAVKSYEKIMQLPRDVWPTDLELRLRLARKQAEQK